MERTRRESFIWEKRAVTLVGQRLYGPEPLFAAFGDGQRFEVSFRRTRGGGVEMVYERYLLNRCGPA